MKKRGLSEVVTTLIIILLTLVAISIVWMVISNILEKKSQEISILPFTNTIEIENVKIGAIIAEVQVKKTSGDDEISSLQFITSDGTNTKTYEIKKPQINNFETKTFIIPSMINAKKITIVPVFGSVLGTETKKEINENNIQPTAIEQELVGYWKFEGDAKDYSGNGNDGTTVGSVQFVNGKVGKAINLGGTQYIKIPDADSLTPTNSFTMIAWINLETGTGWKTILGKPTSSGEYWFAINTDSYIFSKFAGISQNSNGKIQRDTWQQIAISWDGTKAIYYISSIKDSEKGLSATVTNQNYNFIIGASLSTSPSYLWKGQLDEIMLFNRALSEDEIKQIYEIQK